MGRALSVRAKLVCGATPCQPRQGRFATRISTYVYTLHQPTLKPNIGGKTNCVGVVPVFYYLLSVSLYNTSFLPSQLFRYWARITLLPSVSTNQCAYHWDAQAAFSDLRRRCCLAAALPVYSNSKAWQSASNRDLSIAAVQFSFNGRNDARISVYIDLRLWTNNPRLNSMRHSNQSSNTLLS